MASHWFWRFISMKINFAKCEIVPLNVSQEGARLAHNLGCKLGNLPIHYLGVPLHWKKSNFFRLGLSGYKNRK